MARRIIDLSREISHMMPVPNPQFNQAPAIWDRITHGSQGKYPHGDISFHLRDFLIGEHVGTHVDAFCHYDPSPDALSMERMPLEMFMTEAVCIDVSHVKPKTFIEIADLKQGLDKAGLSIRKGDTFLYWQNYYARKNEPNWLHEFAGLSGEATHWLADQGVINIGCECASIDNSEAMPFDANPSFPSHVACRDRKMINTENLANLEAVVGKRFEYIGLPLKLVGGTGCPIRAVAILRD